MLTGCGLPVDVEMEEVVGIAGRVRIPEMGCGEAHGRSRDWRAAWRAASASSTALERDIANTMTLVVRSTD